MVREGTSLEAAREVIGEGDTPALTAKLRKEVALMRSPDVPEDVRRILKTAADLMEHAAAHLDRGQVAEAAAAAHRAKRNPPRWPRRVWSVIFGAFVLGAALAWFLTPPEERAPTNVKAAGVASVAPITRLEDAPADPLVLRLETELAQSVPTR